MVFEKILIALRVITTVINWLFTRETHDITEFHRLNASFKCLLGVLMI